MAAVAENRMVESDRKVLLFLKDQMRRKEARTLESAGLAENAIALGVSNAGSSFSTCLARLKHQRLIESVRAGRVMLYSITREGEAAIRQIIKEDTEDLRIEQQASKLSSAIERANKTGDGDESMAKGTMEDQIKAGIEQGKLPNIYAGSPNTYTAPQGMALPREGMYSQDVAGLQALYKDRINNRPDENELSRLREWFDKLTANGQPAFHWMQEAIITTSTKVKSEQRTIAYMIGILKAWTMYGYGSDLNAEQKRLCERFETRFGYTLSHQSRLRLIGLIDKYGIVNTVASIFETEFSTVDISRLIVDAIEDRLHHTKEDTPT